MLAGIDPNEAGVGSKRPGLVLPRAGWSLRILATTGQKQEAGEVEM